jgi:hypothetical protein
MKIMSKNSDIIDVKVQDSNLLLDSAFVSKLGATPGDRIVIGYIEKEGNLIPVISIGEGGNKLTNSNTVSFRGKQKNLLTQFGTNFWGGDLTEGNYIELKGDGVPVYTEVKKATEAYISKEIILDTNYNITKLTDYEF